MVEELARSLWPESGPLHLTRLHSENNQVYRVKGPDLDVVLKIQGKGEERRGAIKREMETIASLRGVAKVPEVLMHGDKPMPYLVLPFYKSEQADQAQIDGAIADHVTILATRQAVPLELVTELKRAEIKRILGILDRAASDPRFTQWQALIEDLKAGVSELITKDSLIYGQPQPGEVIVTNGDYVVVDWSEGLAPCFAGYQIAFLTYFTAIKDYEAAEKRIAYFQSALSEVIHIDSTMLFQHWLIFCVHAGMWLADQRQSNEPITESMGAFDYLMAAMKL
ncbi:MAG: phosphotransferase [Trueperaceae bacterium]|nr:phosphotransferase [Trueperaceae bacterium]